MADNKSDGTQSQDGATPKLEFHPAADLFPMLDGDDYAKLRDDIKAHDQRVAIQLYDGKVLDGRNRYRVCLELGLKPITKNVNGLISDPLSAVLSLNLHRRHLNASQRAAIAADALPLYEKQARERQAHGQTAPGRALTAKMPEGLEAREQAAAALQVSPRMVSDAKRIKAASPKLHAKVKAGKTTVNKAVGQIISIGAKVEQPARELSFIDQKKADAGRFREIVTELRKLQCEALFIAKTSIGIYVSENNLKNGFENAITSIFQSLPHMSCPHGAGNPAKHQCKACRNVGWITKTMFDTDPNLQKVHALNQKAGERK